MSRTSTIIACTAPAATGAPQPEPFRDAASAWFWSVRVLLAPNALGGSVPARCRSRAATVLRVAERLGREGRLAAAHLRVLTHYGLQSLPPAAESLRHRRLWDEALARLAGPLRRSGIVT